MHSAEEFLQLLAAKVAREPEWALFGRYCINHERGLRKRALADLSEFLDRARDWGEPERQRFAGWLCGLLEQHPEELRKALPHPLVERLLGPTVERWATTTADDPRPHRWLGMLFDEYLYRHAPMEAGSADPVQQHLRQAIAIDPGEQPARVRLVELLIGGVEWDTHHLPQHYIGDPAVTLSLAEQARVLARGVADLETRQRLDSRIEEAARLVEDWIEFQRQGGADFDAWCRSRGRAYHWVRHYYFSES